MFVLVELRGNIEEKLEKLADLCDCTLQDLLELYFYYESDIMNYLEKRIKECEENEDGEYEEEIT